VQSSQNSIFYAEVVVLVDANGMPQPLTYSVPDHLSVQVGDAVLVSVGAQPAVGYVFRTEASMPAGFSGQIKPIEGLVEGAAAFDEQLRDLALYVQEATLCELIDAVRLIAPDVLTSKISTTVSLNPQWESNMVGTRPNPRFGLIIETLQDAGK
jgi:primosomal protein N'